MPPLYVVATPLPVMGMHVAMVRDLAKRDEPIVDFYTEAGRDYTELTICCYDDPEPGLFSKIAAGLLAVGINVHGAQIRTRSGRRQVVLDTLMVDYRGKALSLDVQERAGRMLTDMLLGRTSPEDVLISRGRRLPAKAVIERLSAHNSMSDEHTVVWVTVEDKSGLLYRVTRALAVCGLYLHTAKITTWHASAENVFYVTRSEGGKVADADLDATVAALHDAIQDIPEPIREPA
jgi:[protein-PII] uridylyltransferase